MNRQSPNVGVWLYYVEFIFFIVLEASVVKGSLKLTNRLGVGEIGPYLVWTLFVIGGVILALIELQATRVDQKLRDPFLSLACWLQRRLKVIGFCMTSLTFGPPAAAVAIKQAGLAHEVRLIVVSSILFASLWVPLYILFWQRVG